MNAKATVKAAMEAEPETVTLTFPGVEGHEGADLTLDQAEELIKARKKQMREVTSINATIPVFPWDGARAVDRVMKRLFGWTQGQTIRSFWGDTPPALISVETAFGVHEEVPFGRIAVPKASQGGYIDLSHTDPRQGPVKFVMAAQVLRKDAPVVHKIFAEVRKELEENSIYRGKAIKIRFTNDDGGLLPLPTVAFIDTSKIDRNQLVLTHDLTQQVQTNLFTPFERMQDILADKEPAKRTILLAGPYGTGKSLAARIASLLAVMNNITFVYVDKAADLIRAIDFAKQYQVAKNMGAGVLCEDVERVVTGSRTVGMDELLNIVDGVDSKSWNIITIMTTNNTEMIHAAMVRRFQAYIKFTEPDAEAVERLIRNVASETLGADEDLTAVGKILEGAIPSMIAEVVQRARLAQRSLQEPGTKVTKITAAALEVSAKSVRPHMELLAAASAKPEPVPTVDRAFGGLVQKAVATALNGDAA